MPAGLDWNLWLGPAAERPFHPAYLPYVWRGWVDFGCGALGDMGCYSFDTVYRVLKLAPPVATEASTTPRFPESYPLASQIRLDFAARGDQPPVVLRWWDGGLRPERPDALDPDQALEAEGLLFVGDNGAILADFVGGRPRLVPAARMRAFREPPKTLPRSPGNEREWLDAIQDRRKATGASFEFSAAVTEALCLGNLAVRSGERLAWHSATGQLTGPASVQAWLNPPARDGWGV